MSGFSNDGNFLAKFLTAQQRVSARTGDDSTAQQPQQAPPQQPSQQAQQEAPSQPQLTQPPQAQQAWAYQQQQQQQYYHQQQYQQQQLAYYHQQQQYPQQQPHQPQYQQQHHHQAPGNYGQPQQQPSQQGWASGATSWSAQSAPIAPQPAQPVAAQPPAQQQYQKPADVLAAAGWRKESTPEGLSFWVNDITGETRETEPPKDSLVVLVKRTVAPSPAATAEPSAPASTAAPTDGAAASAAAAEEEQPATRPPPPPPGVSAQAAAVMGKLAARVIRNARRLRQRGESGDAFEELIKQKNTGDPTFSFLFHVGSIGNLYYETLKRFEREVGPEAVAERKAAEAKAERRRRRWGPPVDAKPDDSGDVGAGASAAQTTAEPPAKAADGATRRSAWDTAPEPPAAQTPAVSSDGTPASIEWEGVAIGVDGWRQYTLGDGRQYFCRAAAGATDTEVEVSWERPVARNHTKVAVDAASAEPVVFDGQQQEQSPTAAVGPVGGLVARRDTVRN